MICVLDTGLANTSSVLHAIARIARGPADRPVLTDDPKLLASASRVILPGVGAAGALMRRLLDSPGLIECLQELRQPALGICLGMQILYEASEEGSAFCLGILEGRVTRIRTCGDLPIPHMGWNRVHRAPGRDSRLLNGIEDGSYFYFVHSFRAPEGGPELRALADYGGTIPSVVESGNWFGTQFHPERSGTLGERVLRNFIEL